VDDIQIGADGGFIFFVDPPVNLLGDTIAMAQNTSQIGFNGIDANGHKFFAFRNGTGAGQIGLAVGIDNAEIACFEGINLNMVGDAIISGQRYDQFGGVTTTSSGTSPLDVSQVRLAQNARFNQQSSTNPWSANTQNVDLESSSVEFTGPGVRTFTASVHSQTGINRVTGSNSTSDPASLHFADISGAFGHGLMNFNPGSSNFEFYASDVEGAAGNSPVYWMTYGQGTTFADWDEVTGLITPLPDSSYVDINAAGPDDVAQPLPCCVTATHGLLADVTTYAGRLGAAFGSTLNGNGHSWTTNSLLNTGANWFVNNLNLQPPDRDGDGPNELLLLGRVTLGTQNVIFTNTSDIRDNGAPTDLVIASVRPEFNGVLSKTGVTRILGAGDVAIPTIVTLNAGASLGGNRVELHGNPTLILNNNTLTQDIWAFPDASGTSVRGIGAARVEGATSI
jgi:hypothetical protein